MTKINTIIFDLDGTLLYTLTDLMASTNYAMDAMGMPKRTLSEVRAFVGNGIRKLIERAVPEGTDLETQEKTFQKFKEYYDAHCTDNTVPYDGVLELIERFHENGYKMAIVSNKLDNAVKELNNTFFSKFISVAIGDKEGIRKKPAPDTVYEALRELGSTKEEAVYIGDSDVDLATAKNSGLPCISVLWGFRDEDFLIEKGAKYLAKNTEEVFDMVENFRG